MAHSHSASSATQAKKHIHGVRHIVAVSSGKGGVGKSTVSVNVAVALSQKGLRVGVLDADIYGPNIPQMMGVSEPPHVEEKDGTERFIPPLSEVAGGVDIKVISMGFLVPPDQAMIWRGPMLHSVLNQFCYQVEWGELDYLIIDMPPGTGDVQLSLAQLIPIRGAVMVTTPQEISLSDVRKAFYMWDKVNIPVIGVVENMSYFEVAGERHEIFGKGGAEKLSQKFDVPVLAQLPIIPAIRQGGDEGIPIVTQNPKSEIAKQFVQIAEAVQERTERMAQEVDPAQIVQIGRFE